MANEVAPIPLNAEQEEQAKLWAADDRLWTTQETVEFNLRTFARKMLALASASASPRLTPDELRAAGTACEAQGNIHDLQQSEEEGLPTVQCTRGRQWHALATKVAAASFTASVSPHPDTLSEVGRVIVGLGAVIERLEKFRLNEIAMSRMTGYQDDTIYLIVRDLRMLALALPASLEEETPQARCPRCFRWQDDLDGFGVLKCVVCEYCSHPSINGDVCGLCKRTVADEMKTKSASCSIGEHAKCPRVFDIIDGQPWSCECNCHAKSAASALVERTPGETT